MKKTFVEPALHRIELNLRENIAASQEEASYIKVYNLDYSVCIVHRTGKTFLGGITQAELESCRMFGTNETAWGFGKKVPIEEAIRYVRG